MVTFASLVLFVIPKPIISKLTNPLSVFVDESAFYAPIGNSRAPSSNVICTLLFSTDQRVEAQWTQLRYRDETVANLLATYSNTNVTPTSLATKNLKATDVVTLCDGHTIGIGHYTSFTDRLYPSQDSTMDKFFANQLKLTCPTTMTDLGIQISNVFDNNYYVDLMKQQGLFSSD
uniref:Plant heme peroxidase family profile domain-containing protein n=1 Tax=Nelumbo nucifera TaxID=4432 RepID=A0A822Z6W5_NELNU|nr:TPA_asm: hypothetical protein HUJ06_014910 [Nelumbo nucifera]